MVARVADVAPGETRGKTNHLPRAGRAIQIFYPCGTPQVALHSRRLDHSHAAAQQQFKAVGVDSDVVPYLVDVNTFKPLGNDDPSVKRLRGEWNLPRDAYLVGSFQRDTEGSDLKSPKLVKGPDMFLEILLACANAGSPRMRSLQGPGVTGLCEGSGGRCAFHLYRTAW